jgi:hypothetical protein
MSMGIEGIKNLTDDDYDRTDVADALARKTQDGPGFESEEELPPSDFEEDENDNDQV